MRRHVGGIIKEAAMRKLYSKITIQEQEVSAQVLQIWDPFSHFTPFPSLILLVLSLSHSLFLSFSFYLSLTLSFWFPIMTATLDKANMSSFDFIRFTLASKTEKKYSLFLFASCCKCINNSNIYSDGWQGVLKLHQYKDTEYSSKNYDKHLKYIK